MYFSAGTPPLAFLRIRRRRKKTTREETPLRRVGYYAPADRPMTPPSDAPRAPGAPIADALSCGTRSPFVPPLLATPLLPPLPMNPNRSPPEARAAF
ncbi:hypothetical protein EVAR_43349_1 [Eumeta japonica]|uniref:Uncharacterized protein n=1 Tax=Eumeta variegata TaxID=151549 RepID=A0A4C1WPZ1_EUMVA|nr:hypothetical protein EVAR_43349_1 [Eumeta japonica]